MRGFFGNWKLVATGLILVALLVLGISLGPFSDVMNSFQEKIGAVPDVVERNVSFSIEGDAAPLSFSGTGMDVAVSPARFAGTAKDTVINTTGAVAVSGFGGTVAVAGRNVQLNGKYKKLAVRDVIFAEGPLDAAASYATLGISNVTMDKLVLNGTFTLVVNNVETKLSGNEIVLYNVKGTFIFSDKMRIAGNASAIVMPGIGMQIGTLPE